MPRVRIHKLSPVKYCDSAGLQEAANLVHRGRELEAQSRQDLGIAAGTFPEHLAPAVAVDQHGRGAVRRDWRTDCCNLGPWARR